MTEFKEKVLDSISSDNHQREVLITFPNKVYKRFRNWSRVNASDCYWLAIEKLMDTHDNMGKVHLDEINDKVDFLTQVVANLEQEIIVLKEEKNKPKERKSFGRSDVI